MREPTKKSPIPAMFMNAVIPGAGYMYLGEVWLGLLILVIVPMTIAKAASGTAWLLWMVFTGIDLYLHHGKRARETPGILRVAVMLLGFPLVAHSFAPTRGAGRAQIAVGTDPANVPAPATEAPAAPAPAATTVAKASVPTKAQREQFAAYLTKSGDEPKVKDATWATDRNLYVGVLDDGSRRDGYADYLCSVAADHGVKPSLIKIIDVAKVARTGKFVELGKAYCR